MERESVRRVAAQYGTGSDEAASTANRRQFFRTTPWLSNAAVARGLGYRTGTTPSDSSARSIQRFLEVFCTNATFSARNVRGPVCACHRLAACS